MVCFHGLGHLLRVGSIFWSFFLHLRFYIGWGLGDCCGWACGCFIGLSGCISPKPLGGHYSFSLFCGLVFSDIGLVSSWGGLYWLLAGWGIGPIFPSTSKNVLIFLTIVGWGWSLALHRVHLISWVILSLLKMCVPCIEVIFTSTSTTSTGSWHLK